MKIGALPIFLIGLAVGVIALSYAYFREWMPNKTEAMYYQELRQQREAEGAKLPAAEKRVEDAKAMVNEKAAEWRNVVEQHTPPANLSSGGINLAVNAWQLTVDARTFRNNVQRALNAQVRRGGVTVVNGPTVPFPDEDATTVVANYFNYPAIPFPVVIFDLGTVTVQGTYAQIMANVRSWSGMRGYLAVADGLALTGTSPQLTGTYNLSLVGYIRGDRVYPAVPAGAAPSSDGGGFGGGGPVGAGPVGGGPSAAGLGGGPRAGR
jgi:hypothetical protein